LTPATHVDSAPSCRRAATSVGDARAAAAEIRAQLGVGPHALVLAFVSPERDRQACAEALQEEFPGVAVLGCTTAGEIGPDGVASGTVTAAALPAGAFTVAHGVIEDVRQVGIVECRELVQRLRAELVGRGAEVTPTTTFAMLLVDGLSGAEEVVASALNSALGDIGLVGGSAGDGLRFEQTHVFADGRAFGRGAVLALVHTQLPFTLFKTQHFVPGERRLVVTGADSSRRIVHEIDGEPAARHFAEVLGMHEHDLDPIVFATNPVVVRIGGSDYVRSIQKVEPDGSLTFYCAIEEGIVLRDARGIGLQQNLAEALDGLVARIGEPSLTITFDCILRGLECQRDDKVDEVSRLLRGANCVGFSTYGEQFHGMHINQTLTGVAFGCGVVG